MRFQKDKPGLFSALKGWMVLALPFLLAACAPTDSTKGTSVGAADATGAEWKSYGGTSSEQRFSSLDDVKADNVEKLSLAWSHELDTARAQETTPLMVDGVLYVSTAWSKVVALDATTGSLLWSYDPQVPGRTGFSACCDVINRGVAYDAGRIFLGTLDGRLQALDAKTGHVIWSTLTVDQTKPYTISGAPRVVRGKVMIGNGGADYGVRGYVSAYDEATGKLVWRFYTVPGDPAKPDHAASDEVLARLAQPTWSGKAYLESGGGGTVWDSIVYDKELNQLYIGVGNGSPNNQKFRSQGKGDNLFVASIVALDPDTGRYLWHYQEAPGETWDFTSTAQMILTDLPISGKQRKVILHAPKMGFFYVVDRATGKLISAEKFAPVNWADRIDMKTGRPVENPDARFVGKPFIATSGGIGAHSWQAMSFNPTTGLVYMPVQMVPAVYNDLTGFKYRPGRWNLGLDLMRTKLPTAEKDRTAMIGSLKGWLSAWDPVRQKEVWRADLGGPWNGGTLATAGGLVFQGAADHSFSAFDAKTGVKLWSFAADAGIIGAPITYKVAGVQYVAVVSGTGGALPLALPAFKTPGLIPNGRVLVFKMNGQATLPAATPAAPSAVVAVEADRTPGHIEQGRLLFADNCGSCHGMSAWSSGIIPDLRRSGALGDPAAWRSILIDGALEKQGMISFKKYLTPADAEAIRVYVASESRSVASAARR